MTAEAKVEETHAPEVATPPQQPEKNVDEPGNAAKDEVVSSPKTVQKSSSYREESNFLSDLKDFERKALSDLKSKLQDAILSNSLFNKPQPENPQQEKNTNEADQQQQEEQKPEEKQEEEAVADKSISLWGVPLLPTEGSQGTDVVLLKFLRARDFKVHDAFEMLKKTLQWRKDSAIDSIVDQDLQLDLSSAFYMNGVDREGHPVCYNIYGAFSDKDLYNKAFGSEEQRNQFLRFRFQLMEKGIQKLELKPGGVTSLVQISDLKNSPPPSKKELRTAMNQAVGLLQDNYPEFVAKNIFINVPFWYYALNALLSPFLTQRSKSKFAVARPSKVTETLLKYIPAEEIPVQYGGFKREKDFEFTAEDGVASEIAIKAGATHTIEIPATAVGGTVVWDVNVIGWEVNYKEEFVPSEEGSYTVIISKQKKMNSSEEPLRNSFKNNEAGKVVITIQNSSSKKKRVLYRYKTNKTASF